MGEPVDGIRVVNSKKKPDNTWMPLISTVTFLVFLALVFGLRPLLHWRATRTSGVVGVRPQASRLERFAGTSLVLTVVLGPLAPWLGESLGLRDHGRGVIGVAVMLLGTSLAVVAQQQMGASWRVGVDDSARTDLVTTGAFAVVRNPIFSAMVLVFFGQAVATPTWLTLLLPVWLLIALEVQVRLVEEPYLLQAHGVRYAAWAARTGRFVPWVGRL
jgi:protein-S-isoprenylcysteine O-methyltransferase Ste14